MRGDGGVSRAFRLERADAKVGSGARDTGGGLGQFLEGLTKQPAESGEQEGADESPPDLGKTLKKLFVN